MVARVRWRRAAWARGAGGGAALMAVCLAWSGPGLGGCSETKEAEADAAEAAKARVEAPPPEPAPAEAEPDETEQWGYQMRALGRQIRERTESCRTLALDRMSPAAAEKALPIVKLDEVHDACRWLVARYEAHHEDTLAQHFTLDGVFVKLARFADLYARLVSAYESEQPGGALPDTIAELQRLAERLERNAGALAEFKVDARPANVYERQKVPGGKIRAELETISRNDRSDLGTLLEKFDALAAAPTKKGEAAFRHTLAHFSRLRAAWQRNHRAKLESLYSDNESYDGKLKAEAEAYFLRGDALVEAFAAATAPLLAPDGGPPNAKALEALRKRLQSAHDAWKKANIELPERLSKVF